MRKKTLLIVMLCAAMAALQSFQKEKHDKDEKAGNLKVLPKDISGEELHKVMRGYSQSLGVKCGHCHVSHKVEGQEKPKFDFASDDKPEKGIARDMMKMVAGINKKYIGKMGNDQHTFEEITCVTCHNGRTKPFISVDSLKQKP